MPVLDSSNQVNTQKNQRKPRSKKNNSTNQNQPKVKIDLNTPSQVINSKNSVNVNGSADSATKLIANVSTQDNSNVVGNINENSIESSNTNMDTSPNVADENPPSSADKMEADPYPEFINRSPPILIDVDDNSLKLIREIKADLKINVTAKLIFRHLKLFTENSDFDKLKGYLAQRGVAFQANSAVEDRPFKVVLKGLFPTIPEQEILDAIKELGYSPISAKFMRNHITKQPMPIFVVALERTPNCETILNIRKLINLNIIFKFSPRRQYGNAIAVRCMAVLP